MCRNLLKFSGEFSTTPTFLKRAFFLDLIKMNKIQCSYCGVVNWTTTENCIKCKNKLSLNLDENFHGGYPTKQANVSSDESADKSFIHASYVCGLVIFALIFSYLFWVTILPASKPSVPTETADVSSNPTANANFNFIPEPPPEFNITAPKLESFTLYFQTEIKKHNGVQLSKMSNPTTTVSGAADQWKENEEKRKKREEYISRNKSDSCVGTNLSFDDLKRCDKEKSRLNSEYDQLEVKEMFNSGKVTQCEPKLDGELKFNRGSYENLAGVVFYTGSVSVNGFAGIQKDGNCTFATTAGSLSANFYLKWANSPYSAAGWQQSDSAEVRKYSDAQTEISREKYKKKRL